MPQPTSSLDFGQLFKALPSPYLVLTPALTIAAVTDSYLKATMTSREAIVGRPLFEVFPDNPGDHAASGANNLRASLARVVEQKVADTMAVHRYDIRKPDAEGGGLEERFWSPTNAPVLNADGTLAFILHHVEDVTAFVQMKRLGDQRAEATEALRLKADQMEAEIYKRAQEVSEANRGLSTANIELNRLFERTQAANADLEAFSYSVSHDLRAPLRHVVGFSQMLEEYLAAGRQEDARRCANIVMTAAERMSRLIDDLLAFSRLGRAPISKVTVDLNQLVTEVCATLTAEDATMATREIEWRIDRLPSVNADRSLLRQVLVNLVGNAVKYSSRRSPARITIGATESAGESTVFVQDNGAGFDVRYAERLFGVFQRLHHSDEFEGTGIGLANVKRIITRHGGRVWATGVVDEGATFSFALPKMDD